jgi:hypothetical protein
MQLLLAFTLAAAASAEMVCPSTKALEAAGMEITTTAAANCDTVLAEIQARVAGQATGAWHDPHNNGTYTGASYSAPTFTASRAPGTQAKQPVPDKLAITLTDTPDRQCKIEACSRSQVNSYLDFSTNYCNLEVLLCGTSQGCKVVKSDFTHSTEQTKSFAGSNVDFSKCLTV